MTDESWIEVEAELLHETEKAYRLRTGSGQAWVPKTQCKELEPNRLYSINEMWAVEKGLV